MSHNVARFLAVAASERPEQLAARAPAGRDARGAIRYRDLSFGGLSSDVAAFAAAWRARGIGRGTRTLLLARPGLGLIRTVFALFSIGAPPVVIDPGMGLREFLGCVRRTRPEAVAAPPAVLACARAFPRSFASVRCRVRTDRRPSPGNASAEAGAAETGADETAAILFTSGSTGPPKGVRYTHGVFNAQVALIRDHYGIEPGEVDLPMLPVFALFNPALGMTTVTPEMNPSRPARVNPAKIVRAVGQNAVTNSFGSPTVWARIADHCERAGTTLPSLRRVLLAGAPVPPELLRRLRRIAPGAELHTPYGATEALPVASIEAEEVLRETAERTAAGEGSCVGRPLPGMRARAIEPVDGRVASIGGARGPGADGIGEIVVQGPAATPGYDGLPEADAAAKIADPDGLWHRMGDIGRMDEQGRLWFRGRKAERVRAADGRALDTDCCEALFNAHPKVRRSALIGLGSGEGAEPALVVEPERDAFPRGKRERAVFREELAAVANGREMTAPIRLFYFRKSLPVDVRHNAKIHRLALAREIERRRGKGGGG